MRQAVIDIGTNSTRLMIADVSKECVCCTEKRLETTRLGEGISQNACLKEIPMRRTAEAAAGFVQAARAAGAERIHIYATAAVREAENAADFSDLLHSLSGLTLHILSGEEEACIAYAGACGGETNCAVIDIGGGSTEVMLKNGEALTALSQKIGAVRLAERFSIGDGHLCRGTVMQTTDFLRPYIERYAQIGAGHAEKLIGVSGTPTTLAAMELGLSVYDGSLIQGTVLSYQRICELAGALFEAPLSVRKAMTGVPPARADIIPFGALILMSFMKRYGYDSLTVSDRDSLEGYLLLYGNN